MVLQIQTLQVLFLTIAIITIFFCLRILYILPSINNRSTILRQKKSYSHGTHHHQHHQHHHLLVVLGSGGHTAEILRLLSSVDLSKYSYRTYVVSSGDVFSAKKAVEFERYKESSSINEGGNYSVYEIPRARMVGQSWLTTPLDCIKCLGGCLRIVGGNEKVGPPNVVVCNGPGTAVLVVVGCLVYKFFGVSTTRTIYVESFARVNSLSLSGKILYSLVDRFLVQWPVLAERFPRAEYHGVLV